MDVMVLLSLPWTRPGVGLERRKSGRPKQQSPRWLGRFYRPEHFDRGGYSTNDRRTHVVLAER
jgi:hypothetical protein